MSAAQFPELLTPAEVRAAFGVCPQTVARWAKAGKLHSIRTPGGKDRRFLAVEVDALLAGTPLTPEQIEALKAQAGGTR